MFRALPRTLAALNLAVLALTAAPAGATEGLDPGFWVFPSTPGETGAELHALCDHGMTLVQPGGNWLSYLAGAQRLEVDAEAVCTMDGGDQVCSVHIFDAAGHPRAQTHRTRFLRDATGNLVAHLTVDDSRTLVSYPRMCPDRAVRDLMVGWLMPGADAPADGS